MYACISCTLRVNLVVSWMANSLVEKDVGILADTKATTSQQCAFATQQPQLHCSVGRELREVNFHHLSPLLSPGESSGLLCPVLGSSGYICPLERYGLKESLQNSD